MTSLVASLICYGLVTVKPGVELDKLQRAMGIVVPVVATLMGSYETVITSGNEHVQWRKSNSKHYVGMALDFRLKHMPVKARAKLVKRVTQTLGPAYYVKWSDQGKPNEHLHIHRVVR